MSLTNTAENLLLDWLFTTNSVTRPTAWYVALHTEDPTEAGTVGELTTSEDADYVRKAVTMGDAADGQSLSENSISWTVNSGSSGFTVTHGSVWDAATGGNCLMTGELVTPRVLAANDVLPFNIGEIVATLD